MNRGVLELKGVSGSGRLRERILLVIINVMVMTTVFV